MKPFVTVSDRLNEKSFKNQRRLIQRRHLDSK